MDLTEGFDVVYEGKENEGPVHVVPRSLGELRPEWFLSQKYRVRRLTEEELTYYLRRWEELKKDDRPLRTLWRGQLYAKSPDIFDEKIRETVPETWVSAARVVGAALNKISEEYNQIGDTYIYSRLLELARAGLIETFLIFITGQSFHSFLGPLLRSINAFLGLLS